MIHKTDHTSIPSDRSARFMLAKGILSVLIIAMSAFLVRVIYSLPSDAITLRAQVLANIEASGVENPVTAVLLNFRAYDTLLEIGVLLLAVMGSWSLGKVSSKEVSQEMSPLLPAMVRVLLPVMILIAGYTLWVGKHAPGGAFQAGAILGAAGVLWLVSGQPTGILTAAWMLKLVLVIGFSVFLVIALIVMLPEKNFIHYPENWAGGLILLIESAAAVSIGVTLTALFLGGHPRH